MAIATVLAMEPADPGREAINLDTAIARALANNLQLSLDARRVTQSNLRVDGAAAAFSMEIRPESGAGFSSDGESWRYGASLGKAFITGNRVSVGANYGSELTTTDDGDVQSTTAGNLVVRLDQPLLRNFGTLINGESLLRARRGVLTSMRQLEARKVGLVVDLVAEYERVSQLERQIEIDQQFLARAQRLSRLTRAREAQGRATRVDSLRVELQFGEADARLTTTRQRLDDARRNLAELLGDPPDKVYALEAPPTIGFMPPGLDQALAIAYSNRLDLADALQSCEDALRGVRIAKRQQWPDLSLSASYRQPFASEAEGTSEDPSWFLGLATGSGYSPSVARVAIAVAELDADGAEDLLKIVRRDIEREVRRQLALVTSTKAAESIEVKNLQMAQARATLARRLFEAGRGDSFSVTDAEDALSASHLRLLDSQSQARLAVYELLRSVGTLIDVPATLRPLRAGDR